MQAITEESIHEPCHRDTMTFGFMEKRRDDRSRDDRHVVGRLCHQGYMPRGSGSVAVVGYLASDSIASIPFSIVIFFKRSISCSEIPYIRALVRSDSLNRSRSPYVS